MSKLSILALLTALILTHSARAKETAETDQTDDVAAARTAKALFGQATDLYNQNDFEGAAAKFQAAYNEKPSWKLFYNIGQAQAAAKHQGAALEAFERYLAEGGDDIPAERRKNVNAEIDELRRIVGAFTITAPPGLTIRVDGIDRAITPTSGSIRISASVEHTIELVQEGTVVHSQNVTVAGQETVALTADTAIAVPAPAAGKPTKPAKPILTPQERHLRKLKRQKKIFSIVGLSGLGVGVLGGAVAIAGAVGVKNRSKDIDSNNCDSPGCIDEIATRDDMQINAMAVGVLSVVALGAGVTFIILAKKKKRQLNAANAVSALPIVGPSAAGLSIAATF